MAYIVLIVKWNSSIITAFTRRPINDFSLKQAMYVKLKSNSFFFSRQWPSVQWYYAYNNENFAKLILLRQAMIQFCFKLLWNQKIILCLFFTCTFFCCVLEGGSPTAISSFGRGTSLAVNGTKCYRIDRWLAVWK